MKAYIPHFKILCLILLLCAAGCHRGGSNADQQVSATASAMDVKLKSDMTKVVPMVANIESSLVFMLNSGALAQGVTVQADTTPGAAPYSVTFGGTYDGNGDGIDETAVSGHATFDSDPDSGWTGFRGQAALDVNIPVVGHIYHADVALLSSDSGEQRLSGSGTFTAPITGETTSASIDDASPLIIKTSTGESDLPSNACGYSIEGRMQVDVVGSEGTLSTNWNFVSNRADVEIDNAVFTDDSGQSVGLPDSTVHLRCGGNRTIDAWAGAFLQNWTCLPHESGQAALTITVLGTDTISITDEDPPGSGNIDTYQAKIIGADAESMRGFFIGGLAGNRYREDFNWMLAKDGGGFSQLSTYTYFEGPNTGLKGMCVGSAELVS